MLIYRLTFPDGGHTESEDLEAIKNIKASAGGEIEEVIKTYTVTNDPNPAVFETFDAAQNYINSTFSVEETAAITDPQPEGLND